MNIYHCKHIEYSAKESVYDVTTIIAVTSIIMKAYAIY